MDVISQLKTLKPDLERNGFIIDGVVGSYAHGDYTDESDIDILYHVEKKFMELNKGFGAFSKLAEIKEYLKLKLSKDVDLIASNNLSKTAKKYMLDKVLHV